MSFFSGGNISTRELAEKCERQETQLKKTQTRLTNLVAAYKAVIEEKKTLEESLAAITEVNTETEENENSTSIISKNPETDENGYEKMVGENGEKITEKAETTVSKQEDSRLAKLTASLAAMSSERSKMQNTFQADRKKMKNDFDQELSKITSDRDHQKIERDQFHEELVGLKKSMKDIIRTMETEKTASQIANRELQKQLNSERKKIDQMEVKNRELSNQLSQSEKNLDKKIEIEKENKSEKIEKEFQKTIIALKESLKEKSGEISSLNSILNSKNIEMEKRLVDLRILKDETGELRRQETVEKERKLAEVEEKLASLTDLCAQLEKAKYVEVVKNQSQKETIEQLRTQIDMKGENNTKQDLKQDYFKLFVQAQDDLKQITVELEESKCKLALKEQDEERPRHNSESNEQLDTLKDEVKRLAEALLTAKRHVDKLNQKIHDVEENHKQEVEKIKLGAMDQTRSSETRANEKISEYESQIVLMRERSQKILEDKDNEIELLRKEQLDKENPIENDSISQIMQNGDQNLDTALILYAEQLARKDVEIHSHRNRRKELEDRIRDLQDKLVQSNSESINIKEKLQALERDSSAASKEYLRHLVMQFMACSEGSKKKAMQSALETILEFTKDDIKQLKRNLKR